MLFSEADHDHSCHSFLYIGQPYPHDYPNHEGISLPDCQGAVPPFREFPILPGGSYFGASLDPGTDRIIYKKSIYKRSGGDYQFCGVITHLNAPAGGFVRCTDLQS